MAADRIDRNFCQPAFPEKRAHYGTDPRTPSAAQRSDQGRAEEAHRRALARRCAYDEIAREERVSAKRIRQIISEVLGKRAAPAWSESAVRTAIEEVITAAIAHFQAK
jgi:hypothetical protein